MPIRKFSLKYRYYAFVDTPEYLADQLFIKHKVTVDFLQEFRNPEKSYVIIFCRVRKKDTQEFEKALFALYDKMLLLGHTDYEGFCQELNEFFERYREDRQLTSEGY